MLPQAIKNEIGERMRDLRRKRSLTQAEAGTLTGLSANMVSDIETGKASLSLERLYYFCRKTGTSADYILFGEHPDPRTDTDIILDVTRTMEIEELQCLSDYLVTLIHLRNNR